MGTFPRVLLCLVLSSQSSNIPQAAIQQGPSGSQQQTLMAAPQGPTLEDGTPVKLQFAQTVSSKDAHLNDRVEFNVLEDVRVAGTLIITKGGIAWGTVKEVRSKRRLGRGGKLEIIMDAVRLDDGERAALRATKEVKGANHQLAMTTGIVAAGVLFFPAAPLFLFMKGKDITIPKGTEVPTFINGNFQLDLAKFPPLSPSNVQTQTASSPQNTSTDPQANTNAEIEIMSTPAGAEIELDGTFVGSTPSSIGVQAGDHMVAVRKSGFKLWERNIKVTNGKIGIRADLETETNSTQDPQ